MLKNVSWAAFGVAVLVVLIPYYFVVLLFCFRKDIRGTARRWLKRSAVVLAGLGAAASQLRAQTADGNNGINQANTLVRSYFQTGTQLMYAIGAIVGLVGAIRVFVLWNSGHREEMGRAAGAWFGSCIFLVVVALIIQSFFGV